MTIEYFADHQNLVFVPALLALLVVTVAVCLPIVFAPALRRGPRARSRAIVVVAGLVAVVALVGAGWTAGVGVRRLQSERESVGQQIRERYGLDLSAGDVNELLNGGAPALEMPALAARVGLERTTIEHAFRLEADDAGTYDLTYGGRPVPAAQA